MKKVVYRIIIYVLILGIIAALAFAPNAGQSEPNIAYWIVGGVLLVGWMAFVIANEVVISRKKRKEDNGSN